MASSPITYLGVDYTGAHKPFTYVALDDDCRLRAVGQGKQQEVLAFISGQSAARVAVNGPVRPAAGLWSGEQDPLFPLPAPAVKKDLRAAEAELLRKGIIIPVTPADEAACKGWMQRGFAFYRFLDRLGYQPYPAEGIDCQYLEVQSLAAFWQLIGREPYEGRALEGRLQRQMILRQQGLPVPDPMDFFEEVTPYKLLNGSLPLEKIYSLCELNAWIAAYTAWLSCHHPERLVVFGDPQEGQIILPANSPQPRAE